MDAALQLIHLSGDSSDNGIRSAKQEEEEVDEISSSMTMIKKKNFLRKEDECFGRRKKRRSRSILDIYMNTKSLNAMLASGACSLWSLQLIQLSGDSNQRKNEDKAIDVKGEEESEESITTDASSAMIDRKHYRKDDYGLPKGKGKRKRKFRPIVEIYRKTKPF
ncbi:hypothetical protein F0562_028992 [Nyssa sinensis]|uniref:Uncharacterized protein n=1 Tax=Nyssa sinensis TaxID=561372 RepID=A0A5J5B1J8_9ASTE|nr:hypothetical protein F0562_028992 [Nyssa sinensis]